MTKWMSAYWPGLLLSIAFHSLLIALLYRNWPLSPAPEIKTPRYIKATLVELEEKSAITPKVDSAEQHNRQAAAEKERQRLERKKEVEREKKAQQQRIQEEKAKAEKAKQEKAKEEKAKAARERARQEQLEQQKQQQLAQQQAVADELAREQERLSMEEQAQTDIAISQSYSALIASRIEQNWSRPPSARKGMQCELQIQMVPTGQVIDVKVTNSSGNIAFDRSAIQAVKKIERFHEMKDIPSHIFEQYFRTFKLSFNPKDLPL